MYRAVHTPTAVVLYQQQDISLVVGFSFCSYVVVGKIRNAYGLSAAMESGVKGLCTGSFSGNLR